MEDRRIKNIVNAFGMKGLGLYIMLRLLLEHYSGRGMHVSDAISAARSYCSERIASYILIDSGAFERDDWNFVRTATCVHTGVHTGVHAGVRGGVRAGEPLESSKEDKLSSSSSSSMASLLPPFDAMRLTQADEEDIRADLMDEDNMHWREVVCMHSRYGQLMMKYWPQAVDYFIGHVVAQGRLGMLESYQEVRRYFTNFSHLSTPSGKSLRDYLASLEEAEG